MNELPDSNARMLFSPHVRRDFLRGCGLGLGSIALAALAEVDGLCASAPAPQPPHPLSPKPPHQTSRCKAVIQLFMVGGPSQLELFDDKPRLRAMDGQVVPDSVTQGKRFLFIKPDAKLLGSRRKFARYGQSGAEVSELLPHTAHVVDRLAIVKTMATDNVSHGAAKLITQTGYARFGFPSMGSWVLYALGSESRDLPGYVVLQSGPRGPRGGSYLWSNGFLSSIYQGVPFRAQGEPILNLQNPQGVNAGSQRHVIDAVAELNRIRAANVGDDEILTRSSNYEMARRIQRSAPALIDVAGETVETLRQYGAEPAVPSFAMNCLLARRLVERGVRFVTLFHSNWDHHGGAENLEGELEKVCRDVDQPSAALVLDLQRRGLLDETLVIWGGEFGRTPMGEVRATIGRDHHIEAYTVWLAGGGVRGGQTIGQTDDLGFGPQSPAERIHVHDLHATVMHLLGLDHLRVTHRHQGRDFRLTDVEGKVVQRLL